MAKNLKLNIKNTQLAEALKLNQVKKPKTAEAKKKQETPAPSMEKEEALAAPETEVKPVSVPEYKPEPLVEHREPVLEKTAAPEASIEKQPEASPQQPRTAPTNKPPYPQRPQQEGYQRPAQLNGGYQRPQQEGYQRPQQQGGYQRPQQEGYQRPQQQGGYQRPQQEGFQRSPQQGGYQRPTQQGGYQRPSNQGYQSRESSGGYPSRNYPPRTGGPGGASSTSRPPYQSRRPGEGGGYPPRQEGSGPGFTPRRFGPPSDFPRRPMPPRDLPTKPLDEQSRRTQKPARVDDKGKLKETREVKPGKKLGDTRAFDSRDRQGLRDSSDESWRKRRPVKTRSVFTEEMVIRPKKLSVRLPISIKDLASEMKLKASQLISKLFMQGVILTLNDLLDDETTVQLLGHEFDCQITIDTSEAERLRITDKTIRQEIQDTSAELLTLRPPVVAFMGHVDHGKTSLIDAIRTTNVAAGEAGAITQHIGAFRCHTSVGDIAILDTPGHEAFSAMRARGADVTDIVVLVVAGDEGMRAQTLEALEQAKAAQLPVVVAINKCDKPNFNQENVYRQLADQNLLPEAWGGSTITINCSALTKQGVPELLEMLALQAEILELRANPASRARGTVIESEMHKGMGAVATLLVQNGTLKLGDAVVFDQHWARVKTMHDENGKEIKEASPSSPVKITGLSGIPGAGSEFIVVKSEKEARDLSHQRSIGQKHEASLLSKKPGLESLMLSKSEPQKKVLHLILRADVQGSLDALKTSLMKIPSKKVEITVVSSEVGEISESDIQLAAASKAIILGFHTQIESHAESLIKQLKVTVKLHDIIYHAVDDMKALMLGLLDKIAQESDVGEAVVKAVFKSSQLGNIAGCQVTTGTIRRNNHIRVVRDKEVIWKGPVASLKRIKEDVREVTKGMECGILLQNFSDFKENDVLQAFEITYLQQEL